MITRYLRKQRKVVGLSLLFLWLTNAYAAKQVIDLVVDYKTVHFTVDSAQALAINNQIPAPTLHFKEGDHVTINVHNHLKEGTTIHWHGLLVPWNMDGVEGITQEAIPPGGVFSYSFTLKQSGTYWYHSHTGFQEQQGLYGGFIIDPIHPPSYHYTKDYVIVLSDWSQTDPDQIFANLKKDGDYYTPRFPLQPSLARFLNDFRKASPEERKKIINRYEMMQDMRMSLYDLSDVAYDAFLLNGHSKINPWTALIQVGDTVRLRFIGAASSTIYRVKIPKTSMEIVHIQGHDVVPYVVDDFTIAPGETIDVLVKTKENCPYIIYAESADSLGAAYGALLTDPQQDVAYQKVEPFPTPQPVMRGHGIMDHEGMNHGSSKTAMDMNSHNHQMPMSSDMESESSLPSTTEESMQHHEESSTESPQTIGTKYQDLKSLLPTNDPNKPFQEINIELSGYMTRFMWFINGLSEYDAEPTLIEPGKRYRLIFTNTSMMNHPMHIHGHFFILRNGHDACDPFLHTIEVPPGATVVADFDAEASGQWFFHCHHLYHMMAGMSHTFQYTTFKEDYKKIQSHHRLPQCQTSPEPQFVKHPMGHHAHIHQASLLDIGYDPFHNVQKGNLNALIGWDKHKLQLYSEDAEIRKGKVENADLDIFYWYLLNQFWAIKGGVNYFYKPSDQPYWQPGIGIEGLFPYFIYTYLRTYLHDGSVKFDFQLSRDTQLAHNFFLRAGIRSVLTTQTVKKDKIARGLNYIEYILRPYVVLTPSIALFIEYDLTQGYGNLKKILHKKGESATEKVLMLGVSLLF